MKKLLTLLIPFLFISCNCNKTIQKSLPMPEGNWELAYISDTNIPFDELFPNNKPTINFDLKELRVSGKNSCNNYSGKFEVGFDKLVIDSNTMITTKMFCEGKGENLYMAALPKIDSYSFADAGNTLNLTSGDAILMRFKKI